jgi:hypothetical protein
MMSFRTTENTVLEYICALGIADLLCRRVSYIVGNETLDGDSSLLFEQAFYVTSHANEPAALL